MIATNSVNLTNLKVGEQGIIKSFKDPQLSLKLLEMGCLPGTRVKIDCEAPLGCPVCITIGENYHLSLRKSEAETIEIEAI